jgi:hypothetical protein
VSRWDPYRRVARDRDARPRRRTSTGQSGGARDRGKTPRIRNGAAPRSQRVCVSVSGESTGAEVVDRLGEKCPNFARHVFDEMTLQEQCPARCSEGEARLGIVSGRFLVHYSSM